MGRVNDSDLSRRKFVGLAALGVGAAPLAVVPRLGAARTMEEGAAWRGEPGSEPGIILSSDPLASPRGSPDAFRERLRAARRDGIDALFVPVASVEHLQGATRNLLRYKGLLASLSDVAVAIRGPAALGAAREAGKLAAVGHFQGMQMIVEELSLVADFAAAGIGVMALTHERKNWNGDGCAERSDLPLTGLGELAVGALEEAGVLVDLSRVGRRSSLRAMEIARKPVAFTAANAAALHDHPRNITAEQIDACASTGGVIAATAEAELLSAGPATVGALLRHLEYLVDRAGIEHVAVGGTAELGLAAIRRGLRQAGYGVREIGLLLGGNFERVLRQAWTVT